MAISFGKLTLNIHVSVNDGDPLTVGYIEVDHVPSTAQMTKAFQALADGLAKKEEECSPTCAPHLVQFCSPECEDRARKEEEGDAMSADYARLRRVERRVSTVLDAWEAIEVEMTGEAAAEILRRVMKEAETGE